MWYVTVRKKNQLGYSFSTILVCIGLISNIAISSSIKQFCSKLIPAYGPYCRHRKVNRPLWLTAHLFSKKIPSTQISIGYNNLIMLRKVKFYKHLCLSSDSIVYNFILLWYIITLVIIVLRTVLMPQCSAVDLVYHLFDI